MSDFLKGVGSTYEKNNEKKEEVVEVKETSTSSSKSIDTKQVEVDLVAKYKRKN
jgi:hypothetical protein